MRSFNPYADESYRFVADGLPVPNNPSCFIFEKGPFFTKGCDVIVRGEKLKEGKDFIFILPFPAATNRTALRIYGGIYLFKSAGIIPKLSAVSFGERYYVESDILISKLNVLSIVGIFNSTYESMLSDPYVPPVKVIFDKDIWYGEEELSEQITILANTLGEYKEDNTIVYGVLLHLVELLEKHVNDPSINQHLLSRGNIHRHTPEEIGARRKDGNAADAAKLFGYSKNELISYVQSGLPKLSQLGDKLKNNGGAVSNLTLDAALTLLKMNGVTIDRHGGQFNATGDTYQDIETIRTDNKDEVIVNVGPNTLRLDGITGKAYLNDHEIVTDQNIDQIATENTNVTASVKTRDTNTLVWEGDGSSDNQLRPSINPQTFLGAGYDKITHTPKEGNMLGISPSGAQSVSIEMGKLLPKNFTINNIAYSSEFILSKSDFSDLDKVENYSDADMPMSIVAEELLEGKSKKIHRHDQWKITVPRALLNQHGVFTVGGFDGALSSTEYLDWNIELLRKIDISNESLDGDAINVVIYGTGNNEPLAGVIHSQFRITLPATTIKVRGVVNNLPIKAIDFRDYENYTNRFFYLAIDLSSFEYLVLDKEEDLGNNESLIGWVFCDNVGIFSYEINQVTVEMWSGTNEKHIAETWEPHPNRVFNKWYLGLENVENLPFITYPTSESDGYATTISAFTLMSRHNTMFQFAIDKTEHIDGLIEEGRFLEWFSSNYPVRQMIQENPTYITTGNLTYQHTTSGKTIHVYGTIPLSGFVDDNDPSTPNPTYPIGYWYYTVQDFNPSSYLGGKWEKVVTLDVPEEDRVYYNNEVGVFVESLDFIPKSDYYRYVVLLPNDAYNGSDVREVIFEDGREGLEITNPQSPLNGFRYPYSYSTAGIMTFLLIRRTAGTLTPLEDPKYIWERVE